MHIHRSIDSNNQNLNKIDVPQTEVPRKLPADRHQDEWDKSAKPFSFPSEKKLENRLKCIVSWELPQRFVVGSSTPKEFLEIAKDGLDAFPTVEDSDSQAAYVQGLVAKILASLIITRGCPQHVKRQAFEQLDKITHVNTHLECVSKIAPAISSQQLAELLQKDLERLLQQPIEERSSNFRKIGTIVTDDSRTGGGLLSQGSFADHLTQAVWSHVDDIIETRENQGSGFIDFSAHIQSAIDAAAIYAIESLHRGEFRHFSAFWEAMETRGNDFPPDILCFATIRVWSSVPRGGHESKERPLNSITWQGGLDQFLSLAVKQAQREPVKGARIIQDFLSLLSPAERDVMVDDLISQATQQPDGLAQAFMFLLPTDYRTLNHQQSQKINEFFDRRRST